MNILWFRIYWKFGHFRKFYSTTSPLTFLIPPFTVIRGILAAILWLPKDSYNEEFNNIKLWVKVNSDITNKTMFGLNYINTKPWAGQRYIQVKLETIITPNYTIYVSDQNFEKYTDLKNNLQNSISIFTPYLWIAQFIWNIEFIWEKIWLDEISWENILIDSIITEQFILWWKNIDIQKWKHFEFEKLPYQMDSKRNLLWLKEVLFNPKWWPILLKKCDYYQFNGDKILLW